MILFPFTLLLTLTFKENTPGSILVHSALVLSWPLSGRRSALSYAQEGFCYSVIQLCPTLCNRIDHSMPGLSVPHHLPELAQTHVHWVDDAIQQSLPLSPSSPLALRTFMGDQPWAKWLLSSFSIPLFILFPVFSCCPRVLSLGKLILCPHPKAPQMHSHT